VIYHSFFPCRNLALFSPKAPCLNGQFSWSSNTFSICLIHEVIAFYEASNVRQKIAQAGRNRLFFARPRDAQDPQLFELSLVTLFPSLLNVYFIYRLLPQTLVTFSRPHSVLYLVRQLSGQLNVHISIVINSCHIVLYLVRQFPSQHKACITTDQFNLRKADQRDRCIKD
jgi:hypothetical protein